MGGAGACDRGSWTSLHAHLCTPARGCPRHCWQVPPVLSEAAYLKVMYEIDKGVTMNPFQSLKSFQNVLVFAAVLRRLRACQETQGWGPRVSWPTIFFLLIRLPS